MLDGNKISDIKEISKYGKGNGYLLAKGINYQHILTFL